MKKRNRVNEASDINKLRDIRSLMAQADKAPRSKIAIPGREAKEGLWSSAKEVAKSIGASLIYCADCNFSSQAEMSDYYAGYYQNFKIIFYASSDESANDMLETLKREFQHYGSGYMSSTEIYEFKNLKQITAQEASLIIALQIEKLNLGDNNYPPYKQLATAIHYLPTKAIRDEMNKSMDWTINLLKKMKDKDEALKRAAWLLTPDGMAWKKLYDKEQELLKKILLKADKKNQEEKQQKANAEEVIACFEGKSTLNPQYNMNFVPVVVSGGRKFNGKGFVVDIESRQGQFSYHGDMEYWDEAHLYCPTEDVKQTSVNVRYCKLDTTISPDECKRMQDTYFSMRARSTLQWCRSKDPSKSMDELKSWAATICKKYIKGFDAAKYFGIADLNADKARSTAQWACSLSDVRDVSKAEYIISRALSKKGISDPLKYKDVIKPILLDRFGKAKMFA